MKELTGSEKQIKWANDIRSNILKKYYETYPDDHKVIDILFYIPTDAKFWIDHRSHQYGRCIGILASSILGKTRTNYAFEATSKNLSAWIEDGIKTRGEQDDYEEEAKYEYIVPAAANISDDSDFDYEKDGVPTQKRPLREALKGALLPYSTQEKKPTIAETIGELFDNDGSCFINNDGQELDDICSDILSRKERNQKDEGMYKYIFSDTSVIVIVNSFWDYGYKNCFCCQGEGHTHVDEKG